MVETKASVCALDCPDCCSVLVTIENGKGTKLKGNPNHPITRGFLCAKVTQYLEREYHPDRLLYPAKRIGAKGEGRFTRISWDEALDTVATRLKAIAEAYGPEAVLPYSYAGTMGLLNNAGMDRRFFHRLGASRLDRTICSSAGMFGMNEAYSGLRYSTEPEQFAKSKLIIAWGANILGCNVHLWPFIQEARRNGAKLYVIDPVKNRTGAAADRWYPIQPGTDLALALGLMHVIFAEGLEDRAYLDSYARNTAELQAHVRDYTPQRVAELTGIPAEDIVALAREYATTKPAVIRLSYGIQRSERGGRGVQAVAYLPVITGSWQHIGGGLQLSTSQAYPFNLAALERPDFQKKSLGREARIVNMSEFGKALQEPLEPAVKAVVVYNSNPMAIAPDQSAVRRGLLREDLFTVVLEQFQTDTADFADILLPVTTFLEHTDLYRSYGHHYVQLARPALARPGEVRSNVDIFRALAERLGFDEPEFRESEDDMIRAALGSGHPFLEGVTFEKLEREGSVRLNLGAPDAPFQPFAKGGFGTPDGKCEFKPETLRYVPPVQSRNGPSYWVSRFPLELVASKNDNSMNSTFGHRDAVHAETRRLWMNTADADPRGIENGDAVRVYNDLGSVVMEAYVNGGVRPGAVRAPSVSWSKRMPNGQGINTLMSQRLTDIGGGPTLYSCLVQVEKCGD